MSQETRELSKDEIEKAKAEIAKFRGILKGKKIRELTPEERDELAREHFRKRGIKFPL